MNVEDERARGIGRVRRMDLALSQAPQKECIDGAEGKLSRFRLRARTFDIVEEPGDLGAGKIGIKQKPGLARENLFVSGGFERSAVIGSAPVLPDDRLVD